MEVHTHEEAVLNGAEVRKAVSQYIESRGFTASQLHASVLLLRDKPIDFADLSLRVRGRSLPRDEPPPVQIFAVGKTPEEAIRNRWGKVTSIEDLPGGDDEAFDWGRRFRTADGTSMKAAGKTIHNYAVLTWWA